MYQFFIREAKATQLVIILFSLSLSLLMDMCGCYNLYVAIIKNGDPLLNFRERNGSQLPSSNTILLTSFKSGKDNFSQIITFV